MSNTEHLAGTILNRKYKLSHQLGDGGMSMVFAAERLHIGDFAAIKLLHGELAQDPIKKRRFQLEAYTTAAIKHPNVVSVFDYDETHDGQPYLVLELLNGPTLARQLQHGRAMSAGRVLGIITPVCAALNLAHQKGILHRDLKPSNIVLHHLEDGTMVVKLIDFGIVKVLGEDDYAQITQQGFVVGTPEYLSPERYSGRNIDARSDIYSLGVLAYRMLSGRVPFTGQTPTEILQKHVKQPVPPLRFYNAGIAEEVEQVVMRALAKRPDERPATTTQFAAELSEAYISSGDTMDHYSSSNDY
jgi:eukaryotic-like serine/threonine-protein kinase